MNESIAHQDDEEYCTWDSIAMGRRIAVRIKARGMRTRYVNDTSKQCTQGYQIYKWSTKSFDPKTYEVRFSPKLETTDSFIASRISKCLEKILGARSKALDTQKYCRVICDFGFLLGELFAVVYSYRVSYYSPYTINPQAESELDNVNTAEFKCKVDIPTGETKLVCILNGANLGAQNNISGANSDDKCYPMAQY